jgi:aspartate carbamoyltransferase catalytic subunit
MAENLPHILSARQFDMDQLEEIFEHTDRMYQDFDADRVLLHRRRESYQLSTTFYEPSTRTRKSFESAAQAIGMDVITTEGAKQFSSVAKGEILTDTIMSEAQNADVILLRHDEEGAADLAAEVSPIPIINGGDGPGEHPTQALLDLYTIKTEFGRTDNLHVVIGGDLVKGRTARSLAMLLSHYKDNKITFVSLPELQIDRRVKAHLEEAGVEHEETTEMYDALPTADVVYWTRLQLERHAKREERKEREVLAALQHIGTQVASFEANPEHRKAAQMLASIGALATDMLSEEEPEEEMSAISLASNYVIDQAALRAMQGNAIIMHPLPRNNEISQTVDHDSRAKYFVQMRHGKFLRMALLDQMIEKLTTT